MQLRHGYPEHPCLGRPSRLDGRQILAAGGGGRFSAKAHLISARVDRRSRRNCVSSPVWPLDGSSRRGDAAAILQPPSLGPCRSSVPFQNTLDCRAVARNSRIADVSPRAFSHLTPSLLSIPRTWRLFIGPVIAPESPEVRKMPVPSSSARGQRCVEKEFCLVVMCIIVGVGQLVIVTRS